MFLNITAKATCTTLRVILIFLWVWATIRPLIALLGLGKLLLLFITSQKLMLLNFIYGIVTVLINILSCGADSLIIFNQNCLSVDTVPLLTQSCLVVHPLFWTLSIGVLEGTPRILVFAGCSHLRLVVVARVIIVLVILTRVANI